MLILLLSSVIPRSPSTAEQDGASHRLIKVILMPKKVT
jgi:hypothetical protein